MRTNIKKPTDANPVAKTPVKMKEMIELVLGLIVHGWSNTIANGNNIKQAIAF